MDITQVMWEKNHTPIGDKGYQTGLMEKSYDYWYGGHEHLGFYPKMRHAIFKDAESGTQVEILQEGMLDFLNPNERNLKGALHFLGKRPKDQPFSERLFQFASRSRNKINEDETW